MPPWSLGRRVLWHIDKLEAIVEPEEAPRVRQCLGNLREAVHHDIPVARHQGRRVRGRPKTSDTSRRVSLVQGKLRYQKSKYKDLKRRFDELSKTKAGASLRSQWLARVALSHPQTSALGFSETFKDLICAGVDSKNTGCGRSSITYIRDAFVEILKAKNADAIRAAARSLAVHARAEMASHVSRVVSGCSVSRGGMVKSVELLHIHDEATMRLRSHMAAHEGKPSRSRHTAVQQHAAWLYIGDEIIPVLTELDPLAQKDAKVVATTIYRILQHAHDLVNAGLVSAEGGVDIVEYVFVHCLVGDGVSTNQAAAKIIVNAARQILGSRMYLLLFVRCATHQAQLSAKNAAIGPAAAAGTLNAAIGNKDMLNGNLCKIIVKLFKFVVPDYFEEFVVRIREWAFSLTVAGPAELEPDRVALDENFRILYGRRVLPVCVTKILNNGVSQMQHVRGELALPPGDEDAREFLARQLADTLRDECLTVDEKPTLTRFFTFVGLVEKMLLLDYIGCVERVFAAKAVSTKSKNAIRLRQIQKYFKVPGCISYLRRTALSLQLTNEITSLTSTRDTPSELPLLVRLAKGDPMVISSRFVSRVLGDLHLDPDVDAGAAITTLLGTAVDIHARFSEYLQFPYRLALLVRKFNPDGFLLACQDFLLAPLETLDLGAATPLRLRAMACGSPAKSLEFLVNDDIQAVLERAFVASTGSSMDVERKHAETKKNERCRLTHIGVASRNQLIRGFLRRREGMLSAVTNSQAAVVKAAKTNIWSIVWARFPQWRPQAVGCAWRSKRKKATDVIDQGDRDAVRAYVEENRASLEAEVQARLVAAKAQLEMVTTREPVTFGEWCTWFETNEDEFRGLMRTATNTRKKVNRRLTAMVGLPDAAPRIFAKTDKWRPEKQTWQHVLWGRTAWHAMKLENSILTIYLWHFSGDTWVVDFSAFRTDPRTIVLSPAFELQKHVKLFSDFAASVADRAVLALFELRVSGKATVGGVEIVVQNCLPLLAPLPPRQVSAKGLEEDPALTYTFF